MNTHNFSVEAQPNVAMSKDGLEKVIVSVRWHINAVSDKMQPIKNAQGNDMPYSCHRVDLYEFPEPNPEKFIPFESVTPAMLVEWVRVGDKARIDEAIASADEQIAADIARDTDPAVPVPMALVAS